MAASSSSSSAQSEWRIIESGRARLAGRKQWQSMWPVGSASAAYILIVANANANDVLTATFGLRAASCASLARQIALMRRRADSPQTLTDGRFLSPDVTLKLWRRFCGSSSFSNCVARFAKGCLFSCCRHRFACQMTRGGARARKQSSKTFWRRFLAARISTRLSLSC